jgi:hypothetical protein
VKWTEAAVKSLKNVKGSLDWIGKSAKEQSSVVINSLGWMSSKVDFLKNKLQWVEVWSEEFIKLQWEIKKAENNLKTATNYTSSFTQKLKANEEWFKSLWIAAWVATTGIVLWIKWAMKQAVDLQNSLVGLRSIAEGTGQDFAKAQKFIESFTQDGLVSAADAATSLKSLFQRGFSLEESIVLMDRFKDSASFGRQSALWLGEAIRWATEGLKNENSMLVDNAGVTKNVAKMWEEYAKQIGVKTNAMTLDQKREAEYQGILAETKFQVWDATKYAEGYAGAIARQDAASLKLQQTIWTALMPAMTKLTESITAILTPIAEWIGEHPKLSANIIVVTTAILGITTAIIWLGMAIPPMILAVRSIWVVLSLLTWPIGIVIALLTTLAFAVYEVWKNWDTIRPTLLLVWEQIKKDISAIIDFITGYIIDWFNTAQKKVEDAVNYLSRLAQKARDIVWQVTSSVGNSYMSWILSKPWEALWNFVFGWPKAKWWPVSWGTSYLVGEKWPEIFTPATSWNIIPNNRIGGGGSNLVINITGTFWSDAIGEISDAIVMNLKRASYI